MTTILRPEDFGAIGDSIADDTAALQAMFAIPAKYAKQSAVVEFEPGAIYKCTDTIQIAPEQGLEHWQYLIRGNKARLKFVGIGAKTGVQIGDAKGDKKNLNKEHLIFSTILDLHIEGDAMKTPGSIGVDIRTMNFTQFRDCVFGGFWDVISTTHVGGNSVSLTDCHVLAFGHHGISLGNGTSVAGNWRITGGKIQQGGIAINAQRCGHLNISNIDISLCTVGCIHLDKCTATISGIYTEDHQLSDPENGKLFHFKNCSRVTLRDSTVSGTVSKGISADYGAYFENTSFSKLETVMFSRFSRADVVIDEKSVHCTVEADCPSDTNSERNDMPIVINLSDGSRDLTNGRDLPPLPNSQAIPDFDNWAWIFTGGAAITDIEDDAHVLDFPPGSLVHIGPVNPGVGGLNDQTVELSFWMKPIARLGTSEPHTRLRTIMYRDASSDLSATAGEFRGRDPWVFVKQRFDAPSLTPNGPLTALHFFPAIGGNGLRVAIKNIRVGVVGKAPPPIQPVTSLMRYMVDPARSVDDPTDGAPVAVVANALPFGHPFLAQGSAPAYLADGINGQPAIEFLGGDALDTITQIQHLVTGALGAYTLIAVFQHGNITDNSDSPWANSSIISASSRLGISLRASGPAATISHYNGAGFDMIEMPVPEAFVIAARFDGAEMGLSINGAPEQIVEASPIDILAKPFRLGDVPGKLGYLGILDGYCASDVDKLVLELKTRFSI
jgi:hypothetical protein